MQNLVLSSILLCFSALGWAGNKAAPQADGFVCKTVVTHSGCQMQQCEGRISDYPESILVTLPSEVNRVSVHFHGFILGELPQYEKSLSSMIDAFGIQESLCTKKQVTVFPKSVGRCTTYRSAFNTPDQFNHFFQEVSDGVGKDWSKLPVTMSAHSGGGKIISNLLSMTTYKKDGTAAQRADEALYYDAIYSDSTLAPTVLEEREYVNKLTSGEVGNIESWFNANVDVQLKMMMATSSPTNYAKKIIKELSAPTGTQTTQVHFNGKSFILEAYSGNQRSIEFLRTLKIEDTLAGHYGVLSDTWSATH